MEIRSLTADDAAAFWDLRLEALEREPEAFGESAEEHRAIPVSAVAERLERTSADYFVLGAFEGQRLVGSAAFVRNQRSKTKHSGRIWGVYVTPEFRGRGVGRALIAALLERLGNVAGLEQVVLSAASTNYPAKKLYARFGFQTFGHEPNAMRVDGKSVDEDHMILRLTGPSR